MDKCEWCGGDHKIEDCDDEIEITEKGIMTLENTIKADERAKVLSEALDVLRDYISPIESDRIFENGFKSGLKETIDGIVEDMRKEERQSVISEVMSVLDGWFSENMYEDDNYSDKKPKPKIIKMMKIDKVKEEIKRRLEGAK